MLDNKLDNEFQVVTCEGDSFGLHGYNSRRLKVGKVSQVFIWGQLEIPSARTAPPNFTNFTNPTLLYMITKP